MSGSWEQKQLEQLCNEVLSLIEINEARLLNWGFVNILSDLGAELPELMQYLSPVGAQLWKTGQDNGVTLDAILKNLVERKLLFVYGSNKMYRSRFAGAVRLLYLLRQRFKKEDWNTANRLVSDMRIQLQRRRYPARDRSAAELIEQLRDMSVSPIHIAAIDRLVRDSGGRELYLARFQQEAVIQQFRNLQDSNDHALVIGAGTGAGKTKAFYIPALAEVVATISDTAFIKVLAIYPRVELLKDQLSEAFLEARKLDNLLATKGLRPVTIGAYYGDVPTSASQMLTPAFKAWNQTDARDGWVCPFFFCPNDECGKGQLVWSRADVKAEDAANKQGEYGKYARLRCSSCGKEIGSKTLLLTREQMLRQPPDILFTTTEMLNRRLSRIREHPLFGVGVTNPPRLMLLDEIHTYEGLTGAQVAYLLRRWRHVRRYKPQHSLCIVGLSATLTQAESFFAQLTGIPLYNVGYVFPQERDLIEEGMEYNLVLKGDPVSSTSLLSTSVQTAMLLSRVLDSRRAGKANISKDAIGSKIFAFTDKLDVINRWYHIERDAETKQVLAKLRRLEAIPSAEQQIQNSLGQVWKICEDIGHNLQSPLILDLTSSQNRGVDPAAELVIATSTLEVGFNDPEVGAVLQHKAPRSLASFLQRKGRAGRTRIMRPWTVVVASAYGRDRWAFQHAERLFAPTLPPIELPLENSYVRKIQATYALMDWLAQTMSQDGSEADIWKALSSNDKGTYPSSPRDRIARLLNDVLAGKKLAMLSSYLRGALNLRDNDHALNFILWGEPRPLLTEVIPTILRQLETGWQRMQDGKAEPWSELISRNPMPSFVPTNLFSDLKLPELVIRLPEMPSFNNQRPPTSKGGAAPSQPQMREDQNMSLSQALNEFAPGHVTKRFARSHLPDEAHWLALPDEAQLTRGVVPLQYLKIERAAIPTVLTVDEIEYHIYRPFAYTADLIPKNVKNTSSARLIWRSHFLPQSYSTSLDVEVGESEARKSVPGAQLQLARGSIWSSCFESIHAYTQSNGTWVDVTRMAIGVNVDTRYTNGTSRRRQFLFEEDSQRAALGFTVSADVIRFRLRPFYAQNVLAGSEWSMLYRSMGPEYSSYRLSNDVRLDEAGLSSFEIGWLWQLELSMLIATAISRQISLPEAFEEVQQKREQLANRTLNVIFQTIAVDDDEDHDLRGRLHQRLLEHIADPLVQDALNDATRQLWAPDEVGLIEWLQKSYTASVGSALFASLTRMVPDIDPDELVLDVDGESIWISELTAGGVGLVEKMVSALALEPRSFDLQMMDTLQHCDTASLASYLQAVAELLDKGQPNLAQAFSDIRGSSDLPRLSDSRQRLVRILEEHGVPGTREVLVALNTKFVRPNSSVDTDQLIGSVVRHWQEEERRLGVKIDLRVLAVTARTIPEIKGHLTSALARIGGAGAEVDESQEFNLLQSLLWLTCTDSCPSCIERTFSFQQLVRPSRALVLAAIDPDQSPPLIFNSPGWDTALLERLSREYIADVSCDQGQLPGCHQGLLEMLVTPIEVGFQHFYAAITHIRRNGQLWTITLSIQELV